MEPKELSGKKALVTGATGFIGSHLCNRLYKGGVEVHGISRSHSTDASTPVCWWWGDLGDVEFVREVLRKVKPDFIFHLASHVAGSRSLDLVLPTFDSNLASTVNLLTVATEIGCQRIILAGSMEEPEESEINAIPCSPYAAAKWAGSAYARMFHALYQTPVNIARIFMVYGPDQKDVQKLIPYTILSLLRGESPNLTSGQREVDWIYVDDVVDGLIAISRAAYIDGSRIDLGSGKLINIRTVIEKLVKMIDPRMSPQFGGVSERPFEQIRVANISESAAKIHWKPQVSLDEGLNRTVAWYRNQINCRL